MVNASTTETRSYCGPRSHATVVGVGCAAAVLSLLTCPAYLPATGIHMENAVIAIGVDAGASLLAGAAMKSSSYLDSMPANHEVYFGEKSALWCCWVTPATLCFPVDTRPRPGGMMLAQDMAR